MCALYMWLVMRENNAKGLQKEIYAWWKAPYPLKPHKRHSSEQNSKILMQTHTGTHTIYINEVCTFSQCAGEVYFPILSSALLCFFISLFVVFVKGYVVSINIYMYIYEEGHVGSPNTRRISRTSAILPPQLQNHAWMTNCGFM